MVELTDAQIDAALERGKAAALNEPRAASARYDQKLGRVVVELTNGCTFSFPPHLAQGLRVIARSAFGVPMPSRDADFGGCGRNCTARRHASGGKFACSVPSAIPLPRGWRRPPKINSRRSKFWVAAMVCIGKRWTPICRCPACWQGCSEPGPIWLDWRVGQHRRLRLRRRGRTARRGGGRASRPVGDIPQPTRASRKLQG